MIKKTLILLFLFLSFSASADKSPSKKHILLLNSYNQEMQWVKGVVGSVKDILEPGKNNIVLHIENMDSKRFHSEEYFDIFRKYLEIKYRDIYFSLILSSDNNAFNFILQNHNQLYPEIPVVFCGVNYQDKSILSRHSKITGVKESLSAEKTVELALKLHPETEEIFIINDYLITGRSWEEAMRKNLKPFEKKVKLRYSENIAIDELVKQISELKNNTIVLLGVYYTDSNHKLDSYEESGNIISSACKVPLYCLLDFNVKNGAVGGKVISGYSQGKMMSLLAEKILNGENPDNIPVIENKSGIYMFDYKGLKKNNIDIKKLPSDSLILNQPFSVYREYKSIIHLTIILIVILVISVITLMLLNYKRKQAEETLKQIADATWEGIAIHDNGVLLHSNKTFINMFGYNAEGLKLENIINKIFSKKYISTVKNNIDNLVTEPYEVEGLKKDGTVFPLLIHVKEIIFKGKRVRVAALRDLTEQRKLENRIRQSEKMEALGTLAGGIAHDFNNILSAVIGYSELGLLEEPEKTKNHEYYENILKAGKRAKDLVKQILAFSRISEKEKKKINISEILSETVEMLTAALPSTINIHTTIKNTIFIKADPVQIQQIIMNICTNALLSMKEDGGDLDILLKEVFLENSDELVKRELEKGVYSKLTITDTGCGMTEEVKSHIFEPFYTTRTKGEGTGMGLSVVHGIISELKGSISVYSEPGSGTSFSIFIPSFKDSSVPEYSADEEKLPGGSENVLFTDDEEFQVKMVTEILTKLGYNVTSTTDSREALKLFTDSPENYDILISDVTMPAMTGDILAEEIHKIKKDFPVILCSGYSERITSKRLNQINVSDIIMKPVLLRDIAVKIRTALEQKINPD